MNILFDIVIPVGPNDSNFIHRMIDYTKNNIIGYRNIYLISYNPKLEIQDCITINENIFPFNKSILSQYTNDSKRTGWYLQQLLKLYAGFYIPNILDNYLIIDADTIFINNTTFFEDGLPLYNYGIEYNLPYFNHMKLLHPSLTKQQNISGICHHMVFQKNILQELFKLVEDYHKKDFWVCFMELLNPNDIEGSAASEYEIYFNYILIYHKNKIKIRELKWQNTSHIIYDPNLNYISCHWYMR
jgi:hypothetical protein